MKFKKVEIQAFRAYQTIEDGTFDFEVHNKNGKSVADFISLYAPNGFGKTSFYDAVEYGITNSIDRFLKNKLPKDIATNERALKKSSGGQKILRNRYVQDENLPSVVRLYTTKGSDPIENEVPKAKRKNSKDFHFDDSQVRNKYFQTVILSQEWIDAFLKVDDPKERYEKFMTYFGDTNTGEYYKKVVNLLSVNESEINSLKESLQWIQKEINFEVDTDILKKVNEKITELNKENKILKPINDSFSELDSVELSNAIAERIVELESIINKCKKLIHNIDTIFTGNDSIINIDAYYISVQKKIELDSKIKELKSSQNLFNKKHSLVVERKNIDSNRQELFKTDELLKELIKSYSSYEEVLKKIQNSESDIETEEKAKNNLSDIITKNKLKEVQFQINISKSQTAIKDYNNKLQEAQFLYTKTTENKSKLNDGIEKLKTKTGIIESLNKESQLIQLEADNVEKAIKDLGDKELPSEYEKEFHGYKESIVQVSTVKEHITKEEEKLNKLNQEIKEQQELTRDIEIFITKGAELVDKAQSSVCPLCSHDYKTFNELTDKISNNKFLSQKQSELLKTRSCIETVLNELNQSYNEKINVLQSLLQKSLDVKKEELKFIRKKLSEETEEIKNIETEVKSYEDEHSKLKSVLNEDTIQSYQQNILEAIKNEEVLIKSNTDSLKKIQDDLSVKHSQIKRSENNIEILKGTIGDLKTDKNYTSIVDYFNREFVNEKANVELLTQKQTDLTESINQCNSNIQKISNEVKELENILKTTTEELLNKELSESQEQVSILQSSITTFDRYLNTNLDLSLDGIKKEELKAELDKRKSLQLARVIKAERETQNFNLLKELKQNVEPFLKYQKAKKEEAEIIEQKLFLENKLKPILEDERKKISNHLNNQISSFFYEDLINDLYKRIDPHPDYKRLKFICDFKEDKPKLNVCLYKDGNDDDPIIPNLYFSTAQLNILSLSIFLAKALNAIDDKGNPIESIFIDDPIQSMDSINILSTIDLFRGIVVNQNKQIILSTHDENFHNLLKKKMPPNLFNSKFMELETFGKVKK